MLSQLWSAITWNQLEATLAPTDANIGPLWAGPTSSQPGSTWPNLNLSGAKLEVILDQLKD